MHKSFTFFKTSFFFFLALPLFCIAQGEHNIWYFGENAGIDFNSGSPVALTDGAMNTFEGCGSISDANGNLLFYANPENIWDRTHTIMPNGAGIQGDESSCQAGVIVQLPGSSTIYYVFTTERFQEADGLYYSIVDMSLNGGLGDVTMSIEVPQSAMCGEKVTAVKHQNGMDYWIVVFHQTTGSYHSYLFDANGLNTTPVQSTIPQDQNDFITMKGYLKASSQGDKMAAANSVPVLNAHLYDFDNATGILSNKITLDNMNGGQPYGVEFSPSGELLYVSEPNNPISYIHQYNLLAGTPVDIENSRIQIIDIPGSCGALQVGPDQKIYNARYESNYLTVINDPDNIGAACNVVLDGFHLAGKRSRHGLPLSTFQTDNEGPSMEFEGECIDSPINFHAVGGVYDSLLWDFGDPASGSDNLSDLTDPTHLYSGPGTYTVTLTSYLGGDSTVITQTIIVGSAPFVELGDPLTSCEPDTFYLDASASGASSYIWQDFSTAPSYTVTEPGTYWVTVTNTCGNYSDTISYSIITCDSQIEMPNVFSPNGDHTNDFFQPVNFSGMDDAELTIYNRWGQIVYVTTDLNNGWDGTYNDGECPEGTYFWEVNYSTVEGLKDTAHGFVTLVR